MKLIKALCLAGSLVACTTIGDGDDTSTGPGPTPAPTLDHEGIVTSPRHGGAKQTGDLVVDGFYSDPGATVTIEHWNPISQSWLAAATGTSSATATSDGSARPLYAFHVPVALDSAAWPAGGLVSLRVRIGDAALPSFDAEPQTQQCIDGRATWHDRAASCASGLGTLTLVDTDVSPPASSHRFLDIKGQSAPADVQAYYQVIGAPTSLQAFLTTYGLDAPNTPTLTYYNLGDLATGREIRCKPHLTAAGTGVACTTFNYGQFGTTTEADALDLAVTGRSSGSGWFANVSMVYDPPITAPNAVKFMVYGPTGALQTQAKLDSRGDNTSIPNNCLNCHGSDSSYNAAAHQATGARFLPFDPSAFVFSDRTGVTRNDQEATMRVLNQDFLLAAPSDALADAVTTWYGGDSSLPGVADTSAVPEAWRGPDSAPLYRNVVAVACRGCHASRSDDLAFATPAQFRAQSAAIIGAICGNSDSAHAMPSAEASLARFWSGPARAYIAGFFGPDAMGACVPSGS
ncbi:MAG TPA: hypothetical protein VH165_06575 [Kofleriaceae bacterium]|jgi:hypothetical protein|nr:hypothetical protein [Kofleriaceae bacterium]